MQYQPINFKHKWQVKTFLKNGQLPTVKFDIYGDVLKKGQETVDHLQPLSKGGKSIELNYAIANKFKNNLRGSQPLNLWTTLSNAIAYYLQFLGIKIGTFDGTRYCENGLKYIKKFDLKG